MTTSKIDGTPIWFKVIEDSTRVIRELEDVLEKELVHKRAFAYNLDIANPKITARCFEAYEKRMQAYYTISKFELAKADADHILTFEPLHDLALKIKASIEKANSIAKRTYAGFPVEAIEVEVIDAKVIQEDGIEVEIIQEDSTEIESIEEDGIEVEVIQEESTEVESIEEDGIEVEVIQEESTEVESIEEDSNEANTSENIYDLNTIEEFTTIFNFNESELHPNAFDFNTAKEPSEFHIDIEEEEYTLDNKRQYPFEEMEFSVKKHCHEVNSNDAIDYTINNFSESPFIITPELQYLPNLQQNQLSFNELKAFIVQHITQRDMDRESTPWSNSFKNKDRRKLFDLAQNNDFYAAKQQFNTIIANGKCPFDLVETIFLKAVESNYRQMAVFFGMPKVRLLRQNPTYEEADSMLNSEVYIFKNDANQEFQVGFKESDGSISEQQIRFGWSAALTSHLNNSYFANQLNYDNYKVRKAIQLIKQRGADLPFHVFPRTNKAVIEKAINILLRNTTIDIELLEDLMEYISRFDEYSSFGEWTNDPSNRYSNFVRSLLIWSIKNNWLDIVVLLTDPLFKQELFKINSFPMEAMKIAMHNPNIEITDYLIKQLGITDHQCMQLFFNAYLESDKDQLNYFLNNYENSQLLYDYISSNSNCLIQPQISDTQNQFLLTVLNKNLISTPVQYSYGYLSIVNRDDLNWEIIKYFSAHPDVNSNFNEPYPDNVFSLAIKTQSLELLARIKIEGLTIQKQWFYELLSADFVRLDFLYLLLNSYYFPENSQTTIYPSNTVKTNIIVKLSEDIFLEEDECIEKMLLDKLMDLDLMCPVLLFNRLLINFPSQELFKQVTHYASKLQPYQIHFLALENKEYAIDAVKQLLKTPSIFYKLTPTNWLGRISSPTLDCYELRLEIGIRATYNEFLKIWLLKMAIDRETEVPYDIWRYIGSMALQENTHLVETTIEVCDALNNGSAIKLYRQDNKEGLVFYNEQGNQVHAQNVSLKSIGLEYSFFKKMQVSPNAVMDISAATRQKIVDRVNKSNGIIPIVRTATVTELPEGNNTKPGL